jgi:BAG domain
MLVFAPVSALGYQPRPRQFTQPAISSRDRYVAALAHARSVEAEYVAALAMEEAAQRAREHDKLRRQFLFDSVFQQNSGYLMGDAYSPYTDLDSFVRFYDAEHRAQERRRVVLRQQQEKMRALAVLREQQQDRIRRVHEQQDLQRRIRQAVILQQCQEQEQKEKCALRRQVEVGLKRKEAARREKEELLRVLLSWSLAQAANNVEEVNHFQDVRLIWLSNDVLMKRQVGAATSSVQERQTRGGVACSCDCHVTTSKPAVQRVTCQARASKASERTARAAPSSLKAELESRLGNEYEVEVRDTIQAILASLFHPQPNAGGVAQSSSNGASGTDVKGKGKVVSFDLPTSPPTYNEIANSLAQIRKIEASFQVLESDFVFPRKVDFTPPSSPTSSGTDSPIKLAYTSRNAPIHNYTHALSVLLTQLDAIESFGSDDVRHKRKEVVDRVEGALEGVERVVEEKGYLSRRSSRETLDRTEDVEKGAERKVSAKEFVATGAFSGPSDITEEGIGGTVEPTFPVGGPVSDVSIHQGLSTDNSRQPAIEGYSVTDDGKESESEAVVGSMDGTGQSVVVEGQLAALEGHHEEGTTVSPPVEASLADTIVKGEVLTAIEDADDAVSDTTLLVNDATGRGPALYVPPNSATSSSSEEVGEVDTFLLTASSSPEFPPKRPNVTQDDFVDEGSDWSEVEA